MEPREGISLNGASHASIRFYTRLGLGVVLLLAGGVGGWASVTEIAGAVIAPGTLVVDSHVKDVQHSTGGIVAEIDARDGDRVKAGDLLLRLDRTVPAANLGVVSKALDQLSARKARLDAERQGADSIAFPRELLDRSADPDVAEAISGEKQHFETRRTSRAGQKSQLEERIAQLEKEIVGDTAQAEAKSKEIELVQKELASVRTLWAKKLISIDRLTQTEREATRLDGERGQLVAAQAQAQGRIAEIKLQIIQIDLDLSTEVNKDLRDVDGRMGELLERKVAAEDQLKRVDIRAPQDGVVQQSIAYTVGGVVKPGETIMQVVPDNDSLAVEAKIAPSDIDQLWVGQPASLRFSAFNQRTTPQINGMVERTSPDITTDQRTGISYYTVRITTTAAEVARLGEVKLVPGMPVESFIKTEDRSVMSYLVKPLQDQISRAFRQ
ncbi:HlyD family type I secretion periplasmic adaptor subunit [Mesorhizobium sp.]|jgi:HlyD family secretion protein|uniref:HlyD family type I secretion periplasmic adaptor subunit n=1 Tax=Mesorhizobium sp. TaxID=1871066 RepID=UPI000FE31024|nr:HlyD family type I secretion periplasmic adaptor subunit [Mesorhizobium sp.]RWH70650.1 MAG: HlyD family type I secretion periplasmic adaptor subunit [Mesorhizobium sp.]RWL24264.1 MAG: HlyD family type I secretion periplasmic adaptor subunit [Mesorhizobium sp.]RWL30076.1 MAG: HlyD family type I secretion periplasmic adaptor subunit [Mesorhizobium sp.]RWL37143.1 MAG: HlyD family type I secretion periplasmic adaptor subunit [Mesorhizobium sp.]RWL54206.1 MAG: HlyD family type I secretion peripl